ncbi:hypothetical protein [Tumebacillus flagellatus]|uniref:Uncharacterized protein n=1 Tax=Tumebacillus flagellatus TaxID=1157490 RepID=A0A074LPD2_9BACL|nr:hypothetical protein [Tumebacillus flagellatus]KEO81683.1 hypothetical protein EL26_19625 [Tumebacillus flagellatus]
MKKIVTFLAVSALVTVCTTAHATEGTKGSEIVNDLLQDGLSLDDAKYYAELDGLVKQLSNDNKVVSFNGVEEVSDDYARTHPQEMRKRVLKLDPAALKKAAKSNVNLMEHGQTDIQKQIESDRKKNSIKQSYEVKYPDGSKVTMKFGTEKAVDSSTDKVETNTHVIGPWNSSSFMFMDPGVTASGNYNTWCEWSFSSGVNYSKLKDILNWNYNKTSSVSTDTTRAVSDTGSSASYGVVQIDNESLSNIGSYNAQGVWQYIQGYTDVRFKVTASFSASYMGLGVSGNAGAQWHQYAINEVDGSGTPEHYAATYQ